MYDVALKLAGLAAIGLLGVGILALFAPKRLARSYGVAVEDAASIVWVRATGARDVVLGLILGISVLIDDATLVVGLCCAGLLLSIADFLLAIGFARRFRSEQLAHIGGAVAFLIVVVLISQSARL